MFRRNFFILGNKSTRNMTKLDTRKKSARNLISQKLIFTKMNLRKVAKVLPCSFLSFSFNLFFLSHSLERGGLRIEKVYKYLNIPSYIEKTEKRQNFYCVHYQFSHSIFSSLSFTRKRETMDWKYA